MHTYLDDLFVYSNLVQEHQKYLGMVFKKLREHKLYLREEKCELFTAKVNCLGHMIDEKASTWTLTKWPRYVIGTDHVTPKTYRGF